MDFLEVIQKLTPKLGVTGHEKAAGDAIKELFSAYTKDVWQDKLGNMYARMGSEAKPTVLIMAHMDEVGMMVTDIEENGMLRLCSVAGIDPRVLPGAEVMVYGKEALPGVIGAVPPHLHMGKQNAYKMEELVCDIGYPKEKVEELVAVGDYVTYAPAEPLKLKNDYLTSKTLDDRALVAVMLYAMEQLQKRTIDCSVVFCASIQEERGGLGGTTAAYSVNPDIAIAIDVTHGPTVGADKTRTFAMDSVVMTKGANVHPGVYEMLKRAATDLGMKQEVEVSMTHSGTDAWNMQVVQGGIATGILSPPLKYMHTSVETIKMGTLTKIGQVLVQTLANIDENWEDALCFQD